MSPPVDLDRVRAALAALDIAAADPSVRPVPDLSTLDRLTTPNPEPEPMAENETPDSVTESPGRAGRWIPIRFPAEFCAEVEEDIVPALAERPEFAAMGRVSTALVVRMAAIEGLRVLRERYGIPTSD